MNSLLIFLSVIATLQPAFSLTDTDLTCITTYNNTLDNSYLLGKWYYVYKFGKFLNTIPTVSCIISEFTTPTAEQIQEYKNHYTDGLTPYNIEDSPLIYDETDRYYSGLLMGNNEVKFYVLSPEDPRFMMNGYNARAYRRVNDKYSLFLDCDLRSQTIWLLARDEVPDVAETQAVFAEISELKGFDAQRQCDPY